jgi:hypothetical protein
MEPPQEPPRVPPPSHAPTHRSTLPTSQSARAPPRVPSTTWPLLVPPQALPAPSLATLQPAFSSSQSVRMPPLAVPWAPPGTWTLPPPLVGHRSCRRHHRWRPRQAVLRPVHGRIAVLVDAARLLHDTPVWLSGAARLAILLRPVHGRSLTLVAAAHLLYDALV